MLLNIPAALCALALVTAASTGTRVGALCLFDVLWFQETSIHLGKFFLELGLVLCHLESAWVFQSHVSPLSGL